MTSLNSRNGRRTLPDFVAVGVGRSGTTWLHQMLTHHVGLPAGVKETDFFLRNYAKGIDWYEAFFKDCDPALPIGEICPTYFSSAEVRARIAEHIPGCRIVCTFREPVERAYSHYKLMRHNVWTRSTFEEAVDRYAEIAEMNRYAFHLKGWQDTFGKENVLICLYDDLESDPQSYLNRVCSFIGIESIAIDDRQATARVNSFPTAPRNRKLAQNARHARDWLRAHRAYFAIRLLDRAGVWRYCFEGGEQFEPIPAEVEARLRMRFRPEVEALEELIGRDLSSWKREPERQPGKSTAAQA
jgi:sulfotransferase family protein